MTAFETSCSRFAEYASMDAPELPPHQLSALQVRLARWQTANFGTVESGDIVLGMTEEWGEYLESETDAARADGLGDLLVYTTQLCTSQRLDFGTLLETFTYSEKAVDISVSLGRLAHIALKNRQGIRGYADQVRTRVAFFEGIATMVEAVVDVCDRMGYDVFDIYRSTAEFVLKREWKKDPTGHSFGGTP